MTNIKVQDIQRYKLAELKPWQVYIEQDFGMLQTPYTSPDLSLKQLQFAQIHYYRWLIECFKYRYEPVFSALFELYLLYRKHKKLELLGKDVSEYSYLYYLKKLLDLAVMENCYGKV